MLKLLTRQNILNTWKVGAVVLIGWIALSPDTLYLSTIGSTWFIIGWLPRSAYHLSYEVEIHAAETYAKYLALNGPDDKILEILNDELEHSRELHNAMEMIK